MNPETLTQLAEIAKTLSGDASKVFIIYTCLVQFIPLAQVGAICWTIFAIVRLVFNSVTPAAKD